MLQTIRIDKNRRTTNKHTEFKHVNHAEAGTLWGSRSIRTRDYNVGAGIREVPEGSIFGQFSVKLGPETPLDRRSSSYNAGCTKNQPPKTIT